MKTVTASLTLLSPTSVDEALRMLRDEGPLMPIAGCTDVLVAANFGTLEARRFLDLWPLVELAAIRLDGDLLSIGARATWTQIIRSPLVRRRIPILIEAARQIGGVQIQNRGTIGGNVANASPAGDSLPVLAAADARVVLRSADGERRVAFADFYVGYRKMAMRPDEIIVAIEVPPQSGRQWFRKVGTRAAQAISKVVMAAIAGDGTPRIAIGSVAERVVRLPATERALAAGATLADAQRILLSEIRPIDDVRSTAEYRRHVCANLLARFWTEGPVNPASARAESRRGRSRKPG
jgi:CO/xanthine dehydrogenase FAD-binding subunit